MQNRPTKISTLCRELRLGRIRKMAVTNMVYAINQVWTITMAVADMVYLINQTKKSCRCENGLRHKPNAWEGGRDCGFGLGYW